MMASTSLTNLRGRDGQRPVRCIFLVHHVEALDALVDIYSEMRRAPDFEPIVLSIPRRFPGAGVFGGEEVVHGGLQALGIDHVRFHLQGDDSCGDVLRLLRPDIVFRQSPWDNDIQPGFSAERLRYTRLCYVPYALPIIERYMVRAELEQAATQGSRSFLASCWRIFCETTDSKALFDAGGSDPSGTVVTGSPKFDRLLRACGSQPQWPLATATEPRPYRLIWAPHHSIGPDWLAFGVFVGLAAQMVNWLVTDPSVQIVLKPHPALFDQLERVGAGELATTFLSCWNQLPNAAIAEGGDYGPLFAGSDAMITDGISFLVEYQLSGKPLIFVDSERHVPFNATGQRVVEGCYTVSSFEGLKSVVDSLRQGASDFLAPKRQEIVADYLRSDGGSAARILDELRREVA